MSGDLLKNWVESRTKSLAGNAYLVSEHRLITQCATLVISVLAAGTEKREQGQGHAASELLTYSSLLFLSSGVLDPRVTSSRCAMKALMASRVYALVSVTQYDALIATVLSYIFPNEKSDIQAKVQQASMSRV